MTGPEAKRTLDRALRLEQRLASLVETVEKGIKNFTDRANLKKLSKEILEFVEVFYV